MAYTPYDWTQNLQNRREYVQDQLREGSPVVGISYTSGVLLLTVRRTQEKIFEIYDRLMFSGVGRQADLENLRLAGIDFAHREGFSLSPEDVTAQRVVGVALSPVLKRSFGDFFSHPMVTRSIFAEVGPTPEEDMFYVLDFDGEFSLQHRAAAAAGTKRAEEEMLAMLETLKAGDTPELNRALEMALNAWSRGRYHSLLKDEPTAEEPERAVEPRTILRDELRQGVLEVAVLERGGERESRFRHLREEELKPVLDAFLAE